VIDDSPLGPDAGMLAELVGAVEDPELPYVTIGDLGIVRSVTLRADRHVRVVLTPTFTGCPATAQISEDVTDVVRIAGYVADVELQLAPPWSTDWITDVGREKLKRAGIAPPPSGAATGGDLAVLLDAPVACPQCGSRRTRRQSEFGATACKAPYVCLACHEPFEGFKPL
jgi:ring-1,2-phenylacetyl-CoA epoxidase subunit PaaD